MVFAEAAGLGSGLGIRAQRAALMVVVILILVISARIIPMFTRNAVGVEVSSSTVANAVTVGATALLAVMELVGAPEPVTIGTSVIAGAAALWRARGWRALATLRSP